MSVDKPVDHNKPVVKDFSESDNFRKFKRYLHLGFQTSELEKLPSDLDNIKCLSELIKEGYGREAVEFIVKLSNEGNLENRSYLINCLALCARSNSLETKQAAYGALDTICLTSTDLFKFVFKCEAYNRILTKAYTLQPDSTNKLTKSTIDKVKMQDKVERSPSTGEIIKPNVTKTPKSFENNLINNIQKVETKYENAENVSIERIKSASKSEPRVHSATSRIASAKLSNENESKSLKLPSISNPIQITHSAILSSDLKPLSRINSANKERVLSAGSNRQLSHPVKLEPLVKAEVSSQTVSVDTNTNQIVNTAAITNQTSAVSATNVTPKIPKAKEVKNKGWGRAHKKAINKWYMKYKPMELARMVTMNSSKSKWSHRTIFKKSHPKSDNAAVHLIIIFSLYGMEKAAKFYEEMGSTNSNGDEHEYELNYITSSRKQETGEKSVLKRKVNYKINRDEFNSVFCFLKEYNEFKVGGNIDVKFVKKYDYVVDKNKMHNVYGSHHTIWKWLILSDKLSLEIILRYLKFLSNHYILSITKSIENAICKKINDEAVLEKEKLHPIKFLIPYKSLTNKNFKRVKIPNLNDALYNAVKTSIKHLTPTNKRVCVCFNSWNLSKASLHKSTFATPYQASVALCMTHLNLEPNYKIYGVKDKLISLNDADKNLDYQNLVDTLWSKDFGSINLTPPLHELIEKKEVYDAIVIYTNLELDNNQNSLAKFIRDYRKKMETPKCKFIVVSLTAVSNKVAAFNDHDMLDLLGFTSDLPQIISNYINGLF